MPRRIKVFQFMGWALLFGALLPAVTAQAASRDEMLKAAVRIRYERMEGGAVITGHGTAFGTDLSAYGYPGRRYLLSAAHNVLDDRDQPFETLKIEVVDGPRTYWLRCRVVCFDESLDLCIVEAGDDLPVLVRLADRDARPGDRVTLAGSPKGTPVALYEGSLTKRFAQGSVRSSARLPFDHGCSGGPLFDASSGDVVGVAVAGIPKDGDLDHNLGLFVPLMGVRGFLEDHRRGSAVPAPAAAPAVAHSSPVPAAVPAPVAAPAPAPQIQTAAAVTSVPALPGQPLQPVAEALPVEVAMHPRAAEPSPNQAPRWVLPSEKVQPVVREAEIVRMPAAAVRMAEVRKPAESVSPLEFATPAQAAPATVTQAANAEVRQPPASESAPAAIAPAVQAELPRTVPTVYEVQPGDNLTKIAKRHRLGLSELLAANTLDDPNLIRVGQRLLIPATP